MPPSRYYDLKGNDINAITDEKKFASDIFLEEETDTKIKILLRNTFDRLEKILQSDAEIRNKYIDKIQNNQSVCAKYKSAPALSMLWEPSYTFREFLYKAAARRKCYGPETVCGLIHNTCHMPYSLYSLSRCSLSLLPAYPVPPLSVH